MEPLVYLGRRKGTSNINGELFWNDVHKCTLLRKDVLNGEQGIWQIVHKVISVGTICLDRDNLEAQRTALIVNSRVASQLEIDALSAIINIRDCLPCIRRYIDSLAESNGPTAQPNLSDKFGVDVSNMRLFSSQLRYETYTGIDAPRIHYYPAIDLWSHPSDWQYGLFVRAAILTPKRDKMITEWMRKTFQPPLQIAY